MPQNWSTSGTSLRERSRSGYACSMFTFEWVGPPWSVHIAQVRPKFFAMMALVTIG